MKKKFDWLFLLLAICNILCAAAVVILCMRVHIETKNIQEQGQVSQQMLSDMQERISEFDTSLEAKLTEMAQAEAEVSGRKDSENKDKNNAGTKEEQVQEEPEEPEEPEGNGKTIAIDPGHQGSWVDMSAQEPNAPGSSEMKAKCSTGTEGTYSGIPEYQLNLDVSLKVKEVLEDRGYKVVMTRTDNDAAVSNAERAQFAYSQGADIYVRVHANGDDTHTVSGALTMGPSSDNPYVGHMYDDCQKLCQCILDSYCAATGFKNLGVQHYDNMTGINWSQIPVTIIEMGFMTSEHDDLKMAESEFQQVMAEGIADGIDAYFS